MLTLFIGSPFIEIYNLWTCIAKMESVMGIVLAILADIESSNIYELEKRKLYSVSVSEPEGKIADVMFNGTRRIKPTEEILYCNENIFM